MAGERTSEGWQLRLRAAGVGRYLTGAFLALWLCGWTVGEAMALWALGAGAWSLLTGRSVPPVHGPVELFPAILVGLFLIVWLTFWTIGGIAAWSELLRVLWGEDRLTVSGGRLEFLRIRGPLRIARTFERDAIRRVSLAGGDDRLVLETAGQRVELSRLGSRGERMEGLVALRRELGLAESPAGAVAGPPRGWEETIMPEGERALVESVSTRRTQARVASVATMLMAGLTFLVARQALHRIDLLIAAFILLVFTVGLGTGALWLARGRREWRIGTSRLTLRKRYGGSVQDVFEARRLMLDRSLDGDGDSMFVLYAMAEAQEASSSSAPIQWRTMSTKNSRTIARETHDAERLRDLATWLARETGLPLEDRTTPQAREAQLAELRALLEKSGPFGQWASKLVDRLEERKKTG